jgi:hypothetical protein
MREVENNFAFCDYQPRHLERQVAANVDGFEVALERHPPTRIKRRPA